MLTVWRIEWRDKKVGPYYGCMEGEQWPRNAFGAVDLWPEASSERPSPWEDGIGDAHLAIPNEFRRFGFKDMRQLVWWLPGDWRRKLKEVKHRDDRLVVRRFEVTRYLEGRHQVVFDVRQAQPMGWRYL